MLWHDGTRSYSSRREKKVLDRVKKMMFRASVGPCSDVDEILDDLSVLQDGIKEEIRHIEEVQPRRINEPPLP